MKLFFTCFLILCCCVVRAGSVAMPAETDTLYMRSKEKQVVEMKEVYPDEIRYRKSGEAALLTAPRCDVAEIVYANGVKDVFNPFWSAEKPDIRWTTDTRYTIKPELRLNACIRNGAGNIRIEVNGVLSPLTRSFKTLSAKDSSCVDGMAVSQQVILREGKNDVRILAANAYGESTSEMLSVNFEKAGKRVALVVGNSTYASGSQLQNPENDARAITRKLTELGFDVIERIDARQGDLRAAVAQFGSSVQNRDLEVALFYYAGHGMQVAGKNYLLPVDINPQSEMELKVLAVAADEILDQMAALDDKSDRTNIMILDACRDNPLSRSWTRSPGGKGLASMSAPPGSLITFSTTPGSTALDGDGRNSPYTSELLKALDTPGLRLEEIFRTVRVRVMELTNRQQIPMENSLLTREVILNKTTR